MIRDTKVPSQLRKQINKELQHGESIKWISQPAHRFFTPTTITLFLFGIVWTSLIIFGLYSTPEMKMLLTFRNGIQLEHIFVVCGLPFLLVGLGMLSSPLWEWLAATRTVYLITNLRAISIQTHWATNIIKSYPPNQLKDIHTKDRLDCIHIDWTIREVKGSLTNKLFGTKHQKDSVDEIGDVVLKTLRLEDDDGEQQWKEIGFCGVRNPREMEKILKELARSDESRRS